MMDHDFDPFNLEADRLNGMPNLRHGTINIHPLELAANEADDMKKKLDYYALESIYGRGYAKFMKRKYKMIEKSECAFRTNKRPDNSDLEMFTGDIDKLDFPDMFTPNGQRDDIEFDIHEVLANKFQD